MSRLARGPRKKSVPADGVRMALPASIARLDDDVAQNFENDRRPRSALVDPPRSLVKGDQLAIYAKDHGDLEIWYPAVFDRFDENGWMHAEGVYPRQPRAVFHRVSYGTGTGIRADLGTVFYRFADEVTFYYLCPSCRGRGELQLGDDGQPIHETGKKGVAPRVGRWADCPTCDGLQRVVVRPFIEAPERVWHYKATKHAMPSIAWDYPDRPDVIICQIAYFDAQGKTQIGFRGVPKATIDRMDAEPDRQFWLDRDGSIIE
jgi:hypothetical protein